MITGIKQFNICLHGKNRTITAYSNDVNGFTLKNRHELILKKLSVYKPSKNSFAYNKGLCTKDSLNNHLNSNCFIKLDIKSFFNSITYSKFMKNVGSLRLYGIDDDELKSCFVEDSLCIGLLPSPKLSDVYLHDFDLKVENYLSKRDYLRYSRYCDDILLSSLDDDFGDLVDFKEYICQLLKNADLNINDAKTKYVDLNKTNSITFLGLNLSKDYPNNKITISKVMILKTLELIEKYEKLSKSVTNIYSDSRCYFLAKKARSYIGYIKFNSDISYKRFLKKYKNKFQEEYDEKNWK